MSVPASSDDKLWAGLGYFGAACLGIPALILYFVKQDVSPYVKYHFLQSFVYGLSTGILMSVLWTLSTMDLIWFFGFMLAMTMLGITILCWIILIVMGFCGKDYRIPGLAGLLAPYAK